MSILDDRAVPRTSRRRPLLWGAVAVLMCGVLAGAWLLRKPSAPANTATRTTVAAPTAEAAPVAVAPSEPVEPVSPRPVPSRRATKPAPPAPTPPPAPALTLKVNSDVAGASVFVDRVYVGTTPLSTTDITPGSHAVTVAAEGYDSQASTVELTSGTTEVAVQFKVTRLSETIAVIHKHAIGSCEGRLVADVNGLRYETSNAGHAMAVPFSQLKTFEVDYLKKNLRVTRADGKTFNFTDRTPNGDALLVFQQKVQAARAKLAKEGK